MDLAVSFSAPYTEVYECAFLLLGEESKERVEQQTRPPLPYPDIEQHVVPVGYNDVRIERTDVIHQSVTETAEDRRSGIKIIGSEQEVPLAFFNGGFPFMRA